MNRQADAASKRDARRKEAEIDRGLIAQTKQGDQQAFRKLVERYQRKAFSIAFAMLRDENDAREVVQEGFLRVHRNLHKFEGQSSFFTWFYRIVTNLCIDQLRKPHRHMSELDDTRKRLDDAPEGQFPLLAKIPNANPDQAVRRTEIAKEIQRALDALPPYHRGVIVMREIQGMSYDEMATAMGVSKGTIMSRLFHARQKLQRSLAECYREQIGKPPPTRGTDK